MSSPAAPIHDVFLNVRKAYRLLHDYQCMVRDALRYISSQLDIKEGSGRSNFSGDVSNGNFISLNESSWDWLPAMSCEFHFWKAFNNGESVNLQLYIFSDTGFVEGDEAIHDIEKLSDFKAVDESASKFAFILTKGDWRRFYSIDDKIKMRAFLNESKLSDDYNAAGAAARSYDLSCLCSKDKVNEIIEDILTLAKSNGIEMDRVKKPS